MVSGIRISLGYVASTPLYRFEDMVVTRPPFGIGVEDEQRPS
jgi:hypothetical protein